MTTSLNSSLMITALEGIPEIAPGDDLGSVLGDALAALQTPFIAGDLIVVAQKIVSKAEGRYVSLAQVAPSPRALELAAATGKDPRLVELILSESAEVVRAAPNVLIVRHRNGFVMANAGIDRSNVPDMDDAETVLLLPVDADRSAESLYKTLAARFGVGIGVIVSDSFGRPWRNGVTNIAIGAAGVPALIDRRGEYDRQGRRLEVTQVAFGDAVAGAAALVMGEAAEGKPAVLIRGLSWNAPPQPASALVRPLNQDLFR
jgi:coenzyme F420-0:L-glutamate ligase/coenzyme F420-1:gamma-L-glutamate ligase